MVQCLLPDGMIYSSQCFETKTWFRLIRSRTKRPYLNRPCLYYLLFDSFLLDRSLKRFEFNWNFFVEKYYLVVCGLNFNLRDKLEYVVVDVVEDVEVEDVEVEDVEVEDNVVEDIEVEDNVVEDDAIIVV